MTSQQSQLDIAFQREARTGLAVLASLIGIFLLVAYGKYSGWFRPSPVIFSAVVDKETGVETLQPFSPFASVNTNDSRPAPSSTITANNVASDNPPGDFQQSSQTADKPLIPSATGSASVPPSDYVAQRIDPEIKTAPAFVTDSPLRTNNNDTVNNRAGTFQPIAPKPNRLLPDELDKLTMENREGIKLTLSSPPQPSPTVILDSPVQVDEFDSTQKGSASSIAAAQSGPPIHSPTLTELPSLRKTPIAAGNSPIAPNGESVEQVTFNQREPDTADSNSMNRKISPETTLSEFNVDLPVTHSDEQATSIISQDGDSFWLIAQRVYGDGRLFNALYEFNRSQMESFNEIPVGTRISTPPLAELQKKWPQLCRRDSIFASSPAASANTYISTEGDTLFDIAREQLGQASRYLEIQHLNAEQLPSDIGHATPLPAGVQIALPVQR